MIKKFIYRVKEMKKKRKCVLMLASLCLVVAAMFGVTATESFAAEVAGGGAVENRAQTTEESGDLSVKKYVPQASDFINYWGGVSDLSPSNGGGVFTFAHASMTVPLKADDVAFTTNLRIPSTESVENGGDGIDGWVTISFSATPGEEGKDNTFPYFVGAKRGLYLQIGNVSKTGVPNRAWVRVYKKTTDEAFTGDQIAEIFVDDLLVYNGNEVSVKFGLHREQDGQYRLTMIGVSDETEYLNEILDLSDVTFANGKGQTYFSTAIYEGGCTEGEHSAHRGIAIFDANVYTMDASAAQVTLSETSFVYEEGVAHKPVPTVKIGDVTLANNTDYYVQYKNNRDVGTATAVITFIGEYTGNASVEKTFTIAAPSSDNDDDNSGDNNGDNNGTGTDTAESGKKGCKSSIGAGFGYAGMAALVLCAATAVLLIVRRRKTNA